MSENNIQIELLKMNIGRFDHYIATTNAKSSIILAFNALVIGTILLKYDVFVRLFSNVNWCLYIAIPLISLLGILSTASIIYAFRVVNPFLESGKITNDYDSLLFFESISKMGYKTYKEKIEKSNSENLMGDLEKQSYQLALGMSQKCKDTEKSIKCIYWSLVIIIMLFILKGVISYVIL